MQGQGQDQGHRPKAEANNANVNCQEIATVDLSILSRFRYSLEKLQ